MISAPDYGGKVGIEDINVGFCAITGFGTGWSFPGGGGGGGCLFYPKFNQPTNKFILGVAG